MIALEGCRKNSQNLSKVTDLPDVSHWGAANVGSADQPAANDDAECSICCAGGSAAGNA